MAEELQLGIGHLQILLVDAVNDEHIVLCELQASGLHEAESHQLQTDNIVTLHLQVTSKRHLAVTHLY